MTQKRYTEIPKRQKCINKEEPYIGGAEDVIDDELEQPQSVINSAIERKYNSQAPNGMGKVVLKKNKSFASQVTEPNTIYVIQYDFTLTDDVTIPTNCVLEFDGGSINNGTLKNVPQIVNSGNNVIFSNVNFITPIKQNVKLKWFHNTSVAGTIEQACKFGVVDCGNDTYDLDRPVVVSNDLELTGGKFLCKQGSSYCNFSIVTPDENKSEEIQYNDEIEQNAISISNPGVEGYEYVTIISSDKYFESQSRNGTRGETLKIKSITEETVTFYDSTITSYENNITLVFWNSVKARVSNASFVGEYGEADNLGVLLNIENAQAVINDCYFTGCSIGVKLSRCVDSIVENSIFKDIYPWECAVSDCCANITINKCSFANSRHAFSSIGETGVEKYITVSDCKVTDCYLGICTHANAYCTTIINNILIESIIASYAPFCNIKNNTIYYNNKDTNFPAIYLLEAGGYGSIIDGNSIVGACVTAINAVWNNNDVCYFSNDFILTITNNNITGTSVRNNGGISTENIKNLFIKGNVLTRHRYGSIRCENIDNAVIVDNVIDSFIPISNYNYPIVIKNSSLEAYKYVSISGNYINKKIPYQVYVKNISNLYIGLQQLDLAKCEFVNTNIGYNSLPDAAENLVFSSSSRLFAVINNQMARWNGQKWKNAFEDSTFGVKQSGIFSERPGVADIYVGYKYFSTDFKTTEGNAEGIELIHKGGGQWADSLGRNHYLVNTILEHLSLSGTGSVQEGETYDATLIAESGYNLPATITIKLASATLTQGTDYTYNNTTGAIHVIGYHGAGGVTTTLHIIATASNE